MGKASLGFYNPILGKVVPSQGSLAGPATLIGTSRILRACSWSLAGLKRIRGTWLDPFRYNAERKAEQAWLERYVQTCTKVARMLDAENVGLALELIDAFDGIRGYGHVKEANAKEALAKIAELEERWKAYSLREPTPISNRGR